MPDVARRSFRYSQIGCDHAAAFDQLLADIGEVAIAAVVHRLVHGGDVHDPARLIDGAERRRLNSLVHLAPLHMPGNLLGVDMCRRRFAVPQIACFDTAFHATLPEQSWRLPIPRETGLRRYGFHGLNYAHVVSRLPALLGEASSGKIVVAHLGSGASLCMMESLRSIDTTMGYTPANGIVMGTRSGDLDPGVMLELASLQSLSQLSDMVYFRMGLLALSDNESNEMTALLDSPSPGARFAVEYFCRQVSGAIGSLAAKAGGIDGLVFTAGIGEHAGYVRERICRSLAFLGFALDEQATDVNLLNRPSSKPILCIPADEEGMICSLTRTILISRRSK